ncbi:universal stress protein [Streptomyces luteogriseus]|uniref:universal stress protein n=1 Tax=Streptomyces luteogriseus TaxID=68233 RepID=UPI0037904F5B
MAGRADGVVVIVRGDHDNRTGPRSRGQRVVVGVPDEPADSAAVRFALWEVRRRAVEGPARAALLDASADAALLVVGARHPHGRFGPHVGRVTHTVLHHAACPVAVVPERG